MSSRSIIDLDLHIRGSAASYQVSATMRDPASAADVELLASAPLALDFEALLAHESSPLDYGRLLAAAVFRERSIWDRSVAYAAGKQADLRLRIRIAEQAASLHALRWECLCDPEGRPIAADGRVSLLRYVPTSNVQPVPTPTADSLRALVAIACPDDAPSFGLSWFDTAAAQARVEQAVAGAPWIAVLAPNAPAGRATRDQLSELVRRGCDILYLVCHGTLSPHGEPTLWLEREDGTHDRVSGAELVRMLGPLDETRRPLLAILATCNSAGRGDAISATAALGRQLARAGVPAVIAMQGLAPVDLATRFVPVVLHEVLQHGSIDRAVAVARADLPLDTEWWLPVLYTRVESGRLWRELPPPNKPLTVYLSSLAPRTHVTGLSEALQLRGLVIQPDLSQADGGVIHITPDRLDDGRDSVVDRLRHESRIRKMPVLVLREGVSPRELRTLVNPVDLDWHDLALEPTTLDPRGEDEFAAQALQRIVGSQASTRIRGGLATVGLTTFTSVRLDPQPSLLLDWEPLYRDGAYPHTEIWRTRLLPALSDLRHALKSHGLRQIDVLGRARLGMGLAFGYAFREVTETVIRVRQGPAWWRTVRHDPQAVFFETAQPETVGDGPDLTLELNINREPDAVSRFVDAYLNANRLPIGQRLRLEPQGGPRTAINEAEAQAIAAQVRTLLQRYRAPGGEVHLFMAAPLGVAVLLGWQLNGLTPVQYYELPEGGKAYEPACRLVAL